MMNTRPVARESLAQPKRKVRREKTFTVCSTEQGISKWALCYILMLYFDLLLELWLKLLEFGRAAGAAVLAK